MLKKVKSKGRQLSAGINAGSMADIAFLLLIFFLVTTQFDLEKVMKVKLPPWSETPIPAGPSSKAILNIKINNAGDLLLDEELIALNELKGKTKSFILQPTTKSGKPKSPGSGIISLQHDAKTPYGIYLKIYDEIHAAYKLIHEEKARQLYNGAWNEIAMEKRNKIRSEFPIKISEAESFSYAKN